MVGERELETPVDELASGDDERSREWTATGAAADTEARLESLADDIAEVIDASAPADREALHDYAVSLVRERLPVANDDARFVGGTEDAATRGAEPGGRRVAAGYGFLLLLVAPLLLLVFPPVGMLLVLAGIGLIVAGVVSSLFARKAPAKEGETGIG